MTLIEITRPMAPGGGNQNIWTPDGLAKQIVDHFQPTGRILEPCKGGGAFERAMPGCDWCEISEGRDFFEIVGHWDWIVTNPPFRMVPRFLDKAMECSDNIVFLCWLVVFFTKARQRALMEAGFGMVEMLCVPTPPKPWPQSGFQVGATWIKRGYKGPVTISTLDSNAIKCEGWA